MNTLRLIGAFSFPYTSKNELNELKAKHKNNYFILGLPYSLFLENIRHVLCLQEKIIVRSQH